MVTSGGQVIAALGGSGRVAEIALRGEPGTVVVALAAASGAPAWQVASKAIPLRSTHSTNIVCAARSHDRSTQGSARILANLLAIAGQLAGPRCVKSTSRTVGGRDRKAVLAIGIS
jgi:hypothetical protein